MTSAWSATHQSSVAISSNVRNWYECRIVCVSVLSCPQSCPQPSSIRLLAASWTLCLHFPCRLCRTRPPQLHYTVLYCVYCQWFKLRLTTSVKRISIDWLVDWERIPRIIQSTTVRYSSNLSQRVGLQLFSVLWICRVRVKSKAIYLHAACVWQSRSLLSRHIPFVSIMCFEARSIRSLFSVRSTLIRKVKRSKNKKLSWCWQTRATHLPRVWFPISVL